MTNVQWFQFTEQQRLTYAEKVHDLANLAIAGLVFGQFLGDKPYSWALSGWGMFAYFSLTIIAFFFSRTTEKV